jgi:hypothetical protein
MHLGIGLGITRLSGVLAAAPAFSPLDLFGSGEEGAWYDPSDLSTVWQDAAGTTPATAGDPVGRIDDKSGNGNHATQSTSTARPTLQTSGGLYYLDFDGVDDFMRSSSFPAIAQPISAALGFRASAIPKFIIDGHDANQFSLITVNVGGVDKLRFVSGDGPPFLYVDYTYGGDTVARVLANGASSVIAIDGVETVGAASATAAVTAWTLGAAGTDVLPLDGRIYGFVAVDRTLTAGEIDDVEAYLATKSGVTI